MTLFDELITKPIPRELSFSEKEYATRLRNVRQRMANEDIDVLLITNPANQCYLTGYESVMPTAYAVAVVPAEGGLSFHLSDEDVPCLLLNGLVTDVAVFDWSYPLDVTTQLAGLLSTRGHDYASIGVEMQRAETYAYGAMDAHTYIRLRDLLPGATFVDATNLVQEVRLRKSAAEVAAMRQAGVYTWEGIKASIDATRAGASDNEIVAAGYHAMIAAGSEVMTIAPIILTGERAGWGAPHNMHKRVTVNNGDAVYIEYSANFHRYSAPTMRSISVGPPSATVSRLADACVETVELLIENIRPGRTGGDVARAAEKGLARVSDEAYFHGGYGYAVGLGFPPTWTEAPVYIAKDIERVLEPGMTFHLPIWLGLIGECAVGFSETVHVTKDGCDVLTPGLDRRLVVK